MNPYRNQPSRSFWNNAVSQLQNSFSLSDIADKKFDIAGLKVATAGSCFAQHIGRALQKTNCIVLDVELAPKALPWEERQNHGFGLFSARYGNIYTVRQLLQIFQEAFGQWTPDEKIWPRGDRYVDPYRPTVEPNGYVSEETVIKAREFHLGKVREMFTSCGVFIFTLGLTESWQAKNDGAVYPVVPGSSAGGVFDAEKYVFTNFTYDQILHDLEQFYSQLKKVNKTCKMILTVSPVALMATATENHVLVANAYSKSVLRAVAGQFTVNKDDVAYFPSYDICTFPPNGRFFYNSDMRTISSIGVSFIMGVFKKEYGLHLLNSPSPQHAQNSKKLEIDDVCDEEILAAFNKN